MALFFAFVRKYLSLRTKVTVSLGIVDKLGTLILGAHAAAVIGTLPFARFIDARCDVLDGTLLHRHDGVFTDIAAVGDHFFGSLFEIVFHSVNPRLQLLEVVARLDHSDRHHHTVLGIGVDLHVVARRIPAARLLHHSGLGIARAHSPLLFVLVFFLQLVKLLERLL